MTEITNTNTTRQTYYADAGPVLNAIQTLVASSTLAHHVDITGGPGVGVAEIRWTDQIPVDLAGSGTSALWDLVGAICTRRHTVSLYEVVSHLDSCNRAAVAAAITVLCGPR